MPFDFEAYQKRCNGMTTEELNKEWDNYTRQITTGSTSTAASVLLSPLTGGASLIGLGVSAPRIHNARKKREIIEAGLQARGTTHHTHTMDILGPMATVGACSGVTLGLGLTGAELLPSTGGGHTVTEYAISHVAAKGAVEYVRFKAKEFSRRRGEQTPEPGIQTSHTWPLNPPDKERYGPQFRPTIQPYSLFGHSDNDEVPPEILQMSGLHVQTQTGETTKPPAFASPISLSDSLTTADSDASPHTPLQHGQHRSQSLPNSYSRLTNPQQQSVLTLHNSLRKNTCSDSQIAISDAELDGLVAVLSDEDQKILLMRIEMEARQAEVHKTAVAPPLTSQPQPTQLHRSNHVHASHGHRPHSMALNQPLQSSDNFESDSRTTAHLILSSPEELSSIDEQRPTLPPRAPSLPFRPDVSQVFDGSLSNMPLRSPSLPVDISSLQAASSSSQNQAEPSSQLTRKPLPSQQQAPSATSAPPEHQTSHQTIQAQFKDQRQDSGYYSIASTPSLTGSSEPRYYASPPVAPAPNLSGETLGHRDSTSSLSSPSPTSQPPPTYSSLASPPPTYYPPPPSAPETKSYFGQAAAPNFTTYCPVEYTKASVQNSPNVMEMYRWQFPAVATPTAASGRLEPDYGPPPPIPAPWKNS